MQDFKISEPPTDEVKGRLRPPDEAQHIDGVSVGDSIARKFRIPRGFDGAYLKGGLEVLGLGHHYHDAWWRRTARKNPTLTPWNYENQAIFVHIPKTAGLSIYTAFDMPMPHDTHAPVAAYQAADLNLFRNAFVFAVIRNPWDRLVSAFHYLKFQPAAAEDQRWDHDILWSQRYLSGIDTFRDFLQALRIPKFRRLVVTWRHFIPQHYFITEARTGITVKNLIRFEDLEHGLADVAAKIGLGIEIERRNASWRAIYQTYYNDDDRQFVAGLYAKDIALFGYTFE